MARGAARSRRPGSRRRDGRGVDAGDGAGDPVGLTQLDGAEQIVTGPESRHVPQPSASNGAGGAAAPWAKRTTAVESGGAARAMRWTVLPGV
jgi:hypothetical protein